MVLVGQSMGHHADQLLPSGLAGRGEVLGEMRSQHNDEDVSQELEMEGNQVSTVLSTPSSCTEPRDQGLGEPQLSGGSWGLQPREALLAECSVHENNPVLTICTSIHLLCLCFFSHLLFPASRLYFQIFSAFFLFFLSLL